MMARPGDPAFALSFPELLRTRIAQARSAPAPTLRYMAPSHGMPTPTP